MKAALSIHASACPPNKVPRWLVWSGNTISSSRASVGAAAGSGKCGSEGMIEADLALHADLVRRHAALEEIGQLLHVLQIHERERIARAEMLGHAELGQALVGAIFQ